MRGDKHTLSGDIGMTMRGRRAGVGDKCGTHRTEVLRWMNLGKIVGKIIAAGAPSDSEVTVLNAVTDPVVAHIH